LFIGLGTDFWGTSVFTLYFNEDILSAEFLDYYYKLIPLFFSIGGMLASFALYFFFYNISFFIFNNEFARAAYFFLVKKWYFDLVYNNLFVFNLLSAFYTVTFKTIDRGLVEFFGPLSTVRIVNKISLLFSFMQTGFIYNYIFIILISVIFVFSVLFAYSFIHSFANFGLLSTILVTIIFLSLLKK
jgi:hypothetical protein